MKSISVFVNAVWNHFSLAKEAFKRDPQTPLSLGMMSSDHLFGRTVPPGLFGAQEPKTSARLKTSAVRAVCHSLLKIVGTRACFLKEV